MICFSISVGSLTMDMYNAGIELVSSHHNLMPCPVTFTLLIFWASHHAMKASLTWGRKLRKKHDANGCRP